MSRLRARTWTALERRVMRYWRNRNLLSLIILEGRTRRKWGHDLALDAAERIMRTKGIDVGRAMSNLDPIWDAEDFGICRETAAGQILARHPYNTMRGIIGVNWLMRRCIGMFDDWQPSDSNPNIYVRREA